MKWSTTSTYKEFTLSMLQTTCSILFPEIELDFAVPLKDVTVPEKRQARFECVLTREANVIWSKGNDILKIGEKFDIIADGKKHILIINDSQFDDEGEYTAEVDGKKSTARLFVEGKYLITYKTINNKYVNKYLLKSH